MHTSNGPSRTTSTAFESTTKNALETSKSPTNPHVTDPALTSIDKILIGVFVPIGIIASAGAAFTVYSRCFKVSTVAPTNLDIELENQNDAGGSSSKVSESQSYLEEIQESTDGNPNVPDQNDLMLDTVGETTQ